METGRIVEYIDQQKIITAVVMDIKKQRLRLLTETNREVNVSANRLSHASGTGIDISVSRDQQVKLLRDTARRRRELADRVDLAELWDLLKEEADWQDLPTLAELCFADGGADAESAVVRAMFADRIFFKFGTDRFFPHTEEQVEQIRRQIAEAKKRQELIDSGSAWLKHALDEEKPKLPEELASVARILQNYYIFEADAPQSDLARQILSKAGADLGDRFFSLFVRLGLWDENENLDIAKLDVEPTFDKRILTEAQKLVAQAPTFQEDANRRDLTHLRLMTIDGQSTQDFDDAISIHAEGDFHIAGVHIIDVAHYVRKGSALDEGALARGSSIYMPDNKFSMLPPALSEDLCSLKAGVLRPAISILMKVADYSRVVDYEIVASVIEVKDQLTYSDANRMLEEDGDLVNLERIARHFHQQRIANGAVQITLPEVNIRVEENGEIIITRVDRESSSRMLVAEFMIMANSLMADFLKTHETPAVFRSQPQPKNRLYKGDDGTLFQNLMQRRHLSRVVLNPTPEPHSGLGLPCYVTATSPIRKYWDLSTQRQIRSVLGLEEAATEDKIRELFALLDQPMSSVGRLQFLRRRYWLIKHLEGRIGQKETAMVMDERRNQYQVLLLDYMLEWTLPVPQGMKLTPETEIQVVIQHASARKDQLSLYLA